MEVKSSSSAKTEKPAFSVCSIKLQGLRVLLLTRQQMLLLLLLLPGIKVIVKTVLHKGKYQNRHSKYFHSAVGLWEL